MTAHDVGLEALLGEHGVAVISTTGDLIDGIYCASPECAEKDADGDDLAIEFPDMEAFVAHQAAVVRAAGWRRGREEWGMRYETTRDPRMDNPSGEETVTAWLRDENTARAAVEMSVPLSVRNRRLIRRYVTEPEEA